MKIGKIKGDLIQRDLEVSSFNEMYGQDYDGYILTPQTKNNTKQDLYGFYGAIPLSDDYAYKVKTFYR